jgi:hypothetical protein
LITRSCVTSDLTGLSRLLLYGYSEAGLDVRHIVGVQKTSLARGGAIVIRVSQKCRSESRLPNC